MRSANSDRPVQVRRARTLPTGDDTGDVRCGRNSEGPSNGICASNEREMRLLALATKEAGYDTTVLLGEADDRTSDLHERHSAESVGKLSARTSPGRNGHAVGSGVRHNVNAQRRADGDGPVIITDRGRPGLVLLVIDD